MNAFDYLPHRPPALLITEVLDASASGSTCMARVPPGSPFLSAGRFPAFLALEMGAQGAAAGEASLASASGNDEATPQAGFVVRIARARFATADLPAGGDYRVVTALLRAAPPLRTWSCRVELAAEVVAEAEISTFAGGTAE